MIKVGFFGYENKYQGGINYLKNLFFAVKQLDNPKIEIIIFIGRKDNYQSNLYGQYVKTVKTSVLDRYSFLWYVNKIFWRIFNYPIVIDFLIRIYKVDVISHSDFSSSFLKVKKIHWIPDFQALHLTNMWKDEDIVRWKKVFKKYIKDSNRVILSSNSALNDYLSFAPEYSNKSKVLHFVSQPTLPKKDITKDELILKYSISEKYFYLPNQFWEHKNHKVVFEAVKLLKEKQIDVLLVCSGIMKDFKEGYSDHVNQLVNYIKINNLNNNIKLLGLIEYHEVLYFMRYSLAVINPSLFEGWSSTVEESKSIGNKIVLSKIPVHVEQSPKNGIFFHPEDVLELADILENLWNEDNIQLVEAKDILKTKTLEFAQQYEQIVIDISKEN